METVEAGSGTVLCETLHWRYSARFVLCKTVLQCEILRDSTVSETSEHALPVARATAIFRAIFGAVQSATSEDELVTHCFAFMSHFLLLPGNV